MKAALIGMLNNVGSSASHHGGGYYLIMRRLLKDHLPDVDLAVNPSPSTWNEYETLFILEGVNYQENVFNFIGGPQPEHRVKMEAIKNYAGKIINVNVPLDLNAFNKRFGIDHIFPPLFTTNFAEVYGETQRKTVIGDSHSLSVWRPGFGLNRTDGKTLYGFLKTANAAELNEKYDETVLYFGNIDLRFHLMRQPNPTSATKDLFNRYIDFCLKLKNPTIVGLLPVENESRKLPGTGLYKGEKFFGTREARMELREIANSIMRDTYGVKFLDWPSDWVDEDGTKMFEYMEPKQSVHLKPKYYMFANEFVN